MFENDDMPTTERSSVIEHTKSENAATIQIPIKPAETPAAPPHPFVNSGDLLALKIASDPQLSPDGSKIAYTLQQSNGQSNTISSAIWLVQSRGSKTENPRQLTSGKQLDYAPRWSPDGHTLAFLSNLGDKATSQLYLLPLNGGEPRQLSTLPRGISEFEWRPDGTSILAHSPWKPLDDSDLPDTSDTALIYTRLDEQWDGTGYKQGCYQQLWLIPLEGDPLRLTSEPVDIVQSSWSPDGSEIAFCANRRNNPDLSVSMALWVLHLATGTLRRLTPEEGLAMTPTWSPDGQFLAYFYTADQTETSNILPWVVAAHGEEAPQLAIANTQDLTCQAFIIDELRNEYILSPRWYPDSKSLLIAAQERGQVHLYRVDLDSKNLTRLTKGNGRYISAQLSKEGDLITMIRADWFTPGDIWSMNSNGEQLQKLTGVNDPFLRNHQLIRPRRITWQSFDGQEIEGWLYLPPQATDEKAPLILEIHGGPSLAWGDGYVHEFQVLASRGFAVLAANPRGSAGYGEAFCKKTLNDWGGDDFRDLMAGIEHVIATEPVDGSRLGIGGLSYGGYMTNWTITQTNRFKAAVSRNGISSLHSSGLLSDQTLWFDYALQTGAQDKETLIRERSPLRLADRITTPLLLLHAENDLRCPVSESTQLFVRLRKRKHPVEFVRYPGVSHLMDWPLIGTPKQRVDRLERTVAWFERYV